jgi:triosephosphate isomerase
MKLKYHCIIINFKAYKKSLGDAGLKLVKKIESVYEDTRANIYICPQTVDMRSVCSITNLPVLSQHIDSYDFGSHTGHVIPKSVKDAGAMGSLVNHSEYPLENKQIKENVKSLKETKMSSVVCIPNTKKISIIKKYKPDAIAIEPPDIIGGDISVSSARPEIITKSVKLAGKIPLLCGAGIKTGKDVKSAIELGARGILVASGIVKAKDVEKVLFSFVDSMS